MTGLDITGGIKVEWPTSAKVISARRNGVFRHFYRPNRDLIHQSTLKVASKLKATWKKARDQCGDKAHWSLVIPLWIILLAYAVLGATCLALFQSIAVIIGYLLSFELADCIANDLWHDLLKVCREPGSDKHSVQSLFNAPKDCLSTNGV